MKPPVITLVDAVARSRQSPNFEIPSKADRLSLQPGDCAKLIFNDAERMWVLITKVRPGAYEGNLKNIPSVVTDLAYDDPIIFSEMHVCSIVRKSTLRPIP